MDNEKKPEYLEKILQKEGYKAVNEDPALAKEKVLNPLKDATNSLPEDKLHTQSIDKIREKGRSIGGESTTPKPPEGEHKTPAKKILEKGKSIRGIGGSGLGLPEDPLKKKDDFIKTDDNLSEKGTDKQQKQEHQEQQVQHKSVGKENTGIQEVKVLEKDKPAVKRSPLKDAAASLLPAKVQPPEKTGAQLTKANQESKETDTPKKLSKLQQVAMNLAPSAPKKEAPAKIKTPTK